MCPSGQNDRADRREAAQYAWRRYKTWAATSRSIKTWITIGRIAVLVLLIGGALVVACSSLGDKETIPSLPSHTWGQAISFIGALFLALGGFVGTDILTRERELNWVRARSLAEAIKSRSYLLITWTPPYDRHSSEAVPAFFQEIHGIEAAAKDMTEASCKEIDLLERFPDDMEPKVPYSVEQYISHRVLDQQKFYSDSALRATKRLKLARIFSIGLGATAIVSGLLSSGALSKYATAYLGFVGAATAALSAYIFAGRFRQNAVSYQATKRRLDCLASQFRASGYTESDTAERNQLIADCENAISIENRAWLAQALEQQAPGSGAGAGYEEGASGKTDTTK